LKLFTHLLFWTGIFYFASTSGGFSQEQKDSLLVLKSTAPRVFLDCGNCDLDFIKTEITFVNYVRDSKEAQVHILITTQETGSGGTEHTLTFIGKQDFSGMNDTLKYVSRQSDTEDNIRKGLVRVLKMGLIRYVAKTPLAEKLSLTIQEKKIPAPVVDKWNSWVFSISTNSYLNGEKSRSYISLWGKLSAKRITPDWKVDLAVNGSYNEDKFKLDQETISSISKSGSVSGFVVKSINDYWSFGVYGEIFSSTYSNRKYSLEFEPAVEYNFFPYSESTCRQLRLDYWAGYKFSRYYQETIFDKISESLFLEVLQITLEVKQTWGSVNTSLQGSHYFHDFRKNQLVLNNELSLRLFKGLSLDLSGSIQVIHNQLSLPKGNASYVDILLQRSQLATQYYYYTSIGLSYTFGSIYSNVVNPRFGD
jgi:hypothetical protein